MKTGVSTESVDKIRKLVQEKVDQLKKLGDEAWKKGMEQAKPYLDKNPKVKEVIENNADALKQGNVQELFEKAKTAVNEGSTEDLEKYVNQAKDKAQQSLGGGGGLEQYLKMVPGGDQITQKLGQLSEVAKAKGPEAQKLLEQTVKEISDVLSKKSEEAKKITDDAKKQS
jgi:cell division septum initiation protein DivIVA